MVRQKDEQRLKEFTRVRIFEVLGRDHIRCRSSHKIWLILMFLKAIFL